MFSQSHQSDICGKKGTSGHCRHISRHRGIHKMCCQCKCHEEGRQVLSLDFISKKWLCCLYHSFVLAGHILEYSPYDEHIWYCTKYGQICSANVLLKRVCSDQMSALCRECLACKFLFHVLSCPVNFQISGLPVIFLHVIRITEQISDTETA